jgi:hypothetical protein
LSFLSRSAGRRFITTTDRKSLDIEGGSVTSTTSLAEAPTVALSLVASAPIVKRPTAAWVVAARTSFFNPGNTHGGVLLLPDRSCQQSRFIDRATALMGGAFDIPSHMLRALAGPTLYQVEGQSARIGTQLRVDVVNPRVRGPFGSIFFTRSFLGSQKGRGAQLTTLGVGLRFMSGVRREPSPRDP